MREGRQAWESLREFSEGHPAYPRQEMISYRWLRGGIFYVVFGSNVIVVILAALFLAQKISIIVMTVAFRHGYVSEDQALPLAWVTLVICLLGFISVYKMVDKAYLRVFWRLQKFLRIQNRNSSGGSAGHDKTCGQKVE